MTNTPDSTGWISVYERMPELGTECLVWCKSARGPYAMVDCWDEQHEAPVSFSTATIPIGPGWDSGNDFEDVTHWMPIPAAPRPSGVELTPNGTYTRTYGLGESADATSLAVSPNSPEIPNSSPPAGEPVAWRWRSKDASGRWSDWFHGDWKPQMRPTAAFQLEPLYTSPPPADSAMDILQTDAYAEGRRDEQEELSSVLPGTTYMDPPDGGAPTVLEQLQRQAKDAGRYVWLRRRFALIATADGAVFEAVNLPKPTYLAPDAAAELDAAIDAAALQRGRGAKT